MHRSRRKRHQPFLPGAIGACATGGGAARVSPARLGHVQREAARPVRAEARPAQRAPSGPAQRAWRTAPAPFDRPEAVPISGGQSAAAAVRRTCAAQALPAAAALAPGRAKSRRYAVELPHEAAASLRTAGRAYHAACPAVLTLRRRERVPTMEKAWSDRARMMRKVAKAAPACPATADQAALWGGAASSLSLSYPMPANAPA